MSIAASLVFILVSAIHLYQQSIRRQDGVDHWPLALSKCFVIPTLYLSQYLWLERAGLVAPPLWILVPVFYTLGDFLLTLHWKGGFYVGAVSFMVGHVVVMAVFLSYGHTWPMLFVALAVFGFFFARYCHRLKSDGASPLAGYIIYGAVQYAFATIMAATGSILGCIGAVIYSISDVMIVYDITGRRARHDVAIMSTYILANVFLCAALALSAASAAAV